jgi:hypothetical protein
MNRTSKALVGRCTSCGAYLRFKKFPDRRFKENRPILHNGKKPRKHKVLKRLKLPEENHKKTREPKGIGESKSSSYVPLEVSSTTLNSEPDRTQV